MHTLVTVRNHVISTVSQRAEEANAGLTHSTSRSDCAFRVVSYLSCCELLLLA